MNATRSNRINGTSIAGVGMALTLCAGTALGACPPDGKKITRQVQPAARTSQTRCTSACCASAGGDAALCTTAGPEYDGKQVKRERRVIVRGGPEGIRLGDMSFGDLEVEGDQVVRVGPEGKKRHVIKRIERDDDDRTIRFEIRVVEPDGEEHGFSFGGDDLDGQSHRFGPLSFSLPGDGINWIGDRSFVVGVQPEESDEIWFGPDDDDDDAFFKADSRIYFTQQTDDDTITIEINNGRVTAKINGKKVPPSRIRREGGKVSILNEDGEVVATVPVAMGGGGFVVGEPGPVFLTDIMLQPKTPPVMLGIRMSVVDEHTADALDLDEGEGIQIVGVIEGLPAEHAGLQEHDVILRIKGVGVATQEKLHNVLLKREPGDEITFKVARGDDVKEIEVELKAYNAGDLGIELKEFAEPEAFRFAVPGPRGAFLDDDAVEHYMGKLRAFDFDEEAMEEVREAFEEAMEEMREDLPRFNYRAWLAPGEGDWTILHGEDPENVFAIAPRRGARNTDVDKELAELKKQLADVQRQRDELTEELAEIRALLKKLGGQSRRN